MGIQADTMNTLMKHKNFIIKSSGEILFNTLMNIYNRKTKIHCFIEGLSYEIQYFGLEGVKKQIECMLIITDNNLSNDEKNILNNFLKKIKI